MTLDELKQSLQQQIQTAMIDVNAKHAQLRQAEIDLAFLQGQLHGLSQIRIEEPIYSSSDTGHAAGPFLNGKAEEQTNG
jgi:hypothetical protein